MNYLGIDPGLTGAIALLRPQCIELYDIPIFSMDGGGQVDTGLLYDLVKTLSDRGPIRAVVERMQPMPKNGSVASFKTGVTYGAILAVLAILKIPHVTVRPLQWKKTVLGSRTADKEYSRMIAIQEFPSASVMLARKKDHNRAEAALLAKWLKDSGK